MYSRALLLAFVAMVVLAPSVMVQSSNGAIATFVDYNVPPNWDPRASSTSCAALDGDKPFTWWAYYTWAAFCVLGPSGDSLCGQCLVVTNAITGARLMVRIVDGCGKINNGAGLGIDTAGFLALDTDGSGRVTGQLEVNYQFVVCEV